MPLLTIASAICRIRVSLMLQPNVVQLFQPIGGVRATPLSRACAAGLPRTAVAPDRSSTPAAMVAFQGFTGYRLILRQQVLSGLAGRCRRGRGAGALEAELGGAAGPDL